MTQYSNLPTLQRIRRYHRYRTALWHSIGRPYRAPNYMGRTAFGSRPVYSRYNPTRRIRIDESSTLRSRGTVRTLRALTNAASYMSRFRQGLRRARERARQIIAARRNREN